MNYRLSICGRNHLVLTDIFKSCIAIIGTSRSTPQCTKVYLVLFLSVFVTNFITYLMEDKRSMMTFYHCSVNHKSGLPSNTFSKSSYIFSISTSKCAANYVISFEVYDGFIGQKILMLQRQEIQLFGPDWSAKNTLVDHLSFVLSLLNQI